MNLPKIKRAKDTPFFLRGWGSIEELKSAVYAADIPDYSAQFKEMGGVVLTVPDDPNAVGLNTVKKLIASIANLRVKVAQMRIDAIFLLTEWQSAGRVFEEMLERFRATESLSEEFAGLKNKEARDAFLQHRVNDVYFDMEQRIYISVSRCKDFVEACRVFSAGLDAMYEGVSRQFSVVEHQNNINNEGNEE